MENCTICLEEILKNTQATTTLSCQHQFHLSCIGTTFNLAGGTMKCPLCRRDQEQENQQWVLPSAQQRNQVEVLDLTLLDEDIIEDVIMTTSAQQEENYQEFPPGNIVPSNNVGNIQRIKVRKAKNIKCKKCLRILPLNSYSGTQRRI